MAPRLTKILMLVALAAFVGLTAIGNVVDYPTNFAWVQHVLSMDSVNPRTALASRAITTPALWHAAFVTIILGEFGVALLYGVAAAALWRDRHASADIFQNAKHWAVIATTAGFVLWFGGFTVIAGEWFAMWQSQHWNSQDRAFTIYVTMLVVMIFINQKDEGPPAP